MMNIVIMMVITIARRVKHLNPNGLKSDKLVEKKQLESDFTLLKYQKYI